MMQTSPHPAAADGTPRKLRVLLFSTLYPSSARPGHGIFVETRLRHLLASGQVDAKVVAPVPWFHSTDPRHGEYAKMAATPRAESRHGVEVLHPRYLLPPRVGQHVAPFMLALGAAPTVRRLLRDGYDFDVIDAHYYYPDGVAAALLARRFGKPFVVTARGSDLNVIGRYALSRRMMNWAARRAATSIGVCEALTDVLHDWGHERDRLQVIRNGVDLERFRPHEPATAAAALGLRGGPILLCVGNLVEVKGHALALEALGVLSRTHPDARLLLIGEGGLRERLTAQARSLGLADRVTFVGRVPNDQLAPWYSAADVLVLPSHSEGWANVLLEAMACGTPVVATDVGGSSEVIRDARVGRLVAERSAAQMADAIAAVLRECADRAHVRRYAEGFGWDYTTQAQLDLFRRVTGQAGAPAAAAATSC